MDRFLLEVLDCKSKLKNIEKVMIMDLLFLKHRSMIIEQSSKKKSWEIQPMFHQKRLDYNKTTFVRLKLKWS